MANAYDRTMQARQRVLEQAQPYSRAAQQAASEARSTALMGAASGTVNPLLATRRATRAASAAREPFLAQQAAAVSRATQVEQERERAIQEQERTAQQRLGGSLLSAGGQILGTIMPAFAPAAGLATAAGQAIGGQQAGAGIAGLMQQMQPGQTPRAQTQTAQPSTPLAGMSAEQAQETIDARRAQRMAATAAARRPPGAIGGRMGSELIDPWAAQRGGY